MVWLRHKGCTTPTVEYVGATPLYHGPVMRACDWVVLGQTPKPGHEMRVNCPDCGQRIDIDASKLETVDGSPYRYGDRPKPQAVQKKRTLLDRLRAVFSF